MVVRSFHTRNKRARARQNESYLNYRRALLDLDSVHEYAPDETDHLLQLRAEAHSFVSSFAKVTNNPLSIFHFSNCLKYFLPDLKNRRLWRCVLREFGPLMGGSVREWYSITGVLCRSPAHFAARFNDQFRGTARDSILNLILNIRPCGTSPAALDEYIMTTFNYFSTLGADEPLAAKTLKLAWARNLGFDPLLATILDTQRDILHHEWNMDVLCYSLRVALDSIEYPSGTTIRVTGD